MVLFLSQSDVRQALTMRDAIEGMKVAYGELSAKRVDMPLRTQISGQADGVTLLMPAHIQTTGDMGIKIVSVFPKNVEQQLPLIHAMIFVLDATTGQILAMLEGGSLTAIRTGAGSGAATDVLARVDANTVAIIGSGIQAQTQLEAVCEVRSINTVWVYSRTLQNARKFAELMAGSGSIPNNVNIAGTAEEAIKQADIICTATTSSTPVFDGNYLKEGTHINAVGSYTPTMQEVDETTLKRAKIYMDSREGVLEEAGEILIALESGTIGKKDLQAEIGDVINGVKAGRTSDDEITYFKSVGIAVQDAVAANIAYRNAEVMGLGTQLDMNS